MSELRRVTVRWRGVLHLAEVVAEIGPQVQVRFVGVDPPEARRLVGRDELGEAPPPLPRRHA